MTIDLGPISKTLEAEVRTWVRRHGIVVWLDLDDHYSGFVDRLAALRESGELPYEVRAFRGSHLAFAGGPLEILGTGSWTTLPVSVGGFAELAVESTHPMVGPPKSRVVIKASRRSPVRAPQVVKTA